LLLLDEAGLMTLNDKRQVSVKLLREQLLSGAKSNKTLHHHILAVNVARRERGQWDGFRACVTGSRLQQRHKPKTATAPSQLPGCSPGKLPQPSQIPVCIFDFDAV
jgi:hypothetical protein